VRQPPKISVFGKTFVLYRVQKSSSKPNQPRKELLEGIGCSGNVSGGVYETSEASLLLAGHPRPAREAPPTRLRKRDARPTRLRNRLEESRNVADIAARHLAPPGRLG
jgi:hypothetical protein